METGQAMSMVAEIEKLHHQISIDAPKSLNAVQELLYMRKESAIRYKEATGENEKAVLKEYIDFCNAQIKLILAI